MFNGKKPHRRHTTRVFSQTVQYFSKKDVASNIKEKAVEYGRDQR